jgi:hypothetical protein
MINKSLEALLRGYILFDVNGKRFHDYNSALAERKSIDGNVKFDGFHIIKGWQYFYVRYSLRNPIEITINQFRACPNVVSSANLQNSTCIAET